MCGTDACSTRLRVNDVARGTTLRFAVGSTLACLGPPTRTPLSLPSHPPTGFNAPIVTWADSAADFAVDSAVDSAVDFAVDFAVDSAVEFAMDSAVDSAVDLFCGFYCGFCFGFCSGFWYGLYC